MTDKTSNKEKTGLEKSAKKPAARAEKKDHSKGRPNAVTRFIRETVGELRKVNWPTWPEARNLTWVVLLVLIAMSIFLWLIDTGAAWFVQALISL